MALSPTFSSIRSVFILALLVAASFACRAQAAPISPPPRQPCPCGTITLEPIQDSSSGMGALKGTIFHAYPDSVAPAVCLRLYRNSGLVAQGCTDNDGRYSMRPLAPGKYTLECLANNRTIQTQGIVVNANKITFYDVNADLLYNDKRYKKYKKARQKRQ